MREIGTMSPQNLVCRAFLDIAPLQTLGFCQHLPGFAFYQSACFCSSACLSPKMQRILHVILGSPIPISGHWGRMGSGACKIFPHAEDLTIYPFPPPPSRNKEWWRGTFLCKGLLSIPYLLTLQSPLERGERSSWRLWDFLRLGSRMVVPLQHVYLHFNETLSARDPRANEKPKFGPPPPRQESASGLY